MFVVMFPHLVKFRIRLLSYVDGISVMSFLSLHAAIPFDKICSYIKTKLGSNDT